MGPKIWSAGCELFAQYVLQMDQKIYGMWCSCPVIILSFNLAIELQVHCNIAAGCCQIPVKYSICTLAAEVAKDFGQSKFVFLYCILQTPHFFLFWDPWLLSEKFQNWQLKWNWFLNFSQQYSCTFLKFHLIFFSDFQRQLPFSTSEIEVYVKYDWLSLHVVPSILPGGFVPWKLNHGFKLKT